MPKIDLAAAPVRTGTGYPPPYDAPCLRRHRVRLGDAGGLTQFGVNLTTLPPGEWSAQRHWHTDEDEFVYVVTGELTLITDAGPVLLKAGDCAAFPRNAPDGHHLVNRSGADAAYLEIGSRSEDDACHYPDIDLYVKDSEGGYKHKDGMAY